MKQGWTYKKLGEVASFMSGYTPDKSELIPQGKYPYFKVAEMNNPGNELFMRNTSLFIDSPRKVFPKGSIIFPKNGGAIYTEKKRILEYDSVIDLNTEAISPKGQIELKYLFCFLNHIKISSFDKGGGLPSIDLKKMANSLVPIPPLSEQQRIVSRLDSAFAHIDELKANAEKQLNEARALFQKALSKAMEPKEGWEEKKLNVIANYSIGLTYKPIDVKEEGTIVLRSSNIQNDILDLNDIVRVSCPIKESLYVNEGDILMCSRNGSAKLVGKVALIPYLDEKMTYGTFMMLIRSDYNPYLFYFFKSEDFRNQIKHGEANMINQITRYMLDEVYVNVPPLADQHRIVSRLDALSEHVKALEENQRKVMAECDALKQALLRKVFE